MRGSNARALTRHFHRLCIECICQWRAGGGARDGMGWDAACCAYGCDPLHSRALRHHFPFLGPIDFGLFMLSAAVRNGTQTEPIGWAFIGGAAAVPDDCVAVRGFSGMSCDGLTMAWAARKFRTSRAQN
jgi:hypothetical protein